MKNFTKIERTLDLRVVQQIYENLFTKITIQKFTKLSKNK
jgi:hypothetical protein